jgi:zinc protease
MASWYLLRERIELSKLLRLRAAFNFPFLTFSCMTMLTSTLKYSAFALFALVAASVVYAQTSSATTAAPAAVGETPKIEPVKSSDFVEFKLKNGLRVVYLKRLNTAAAAGNKPVQRVTTQMVYFAGYTEQVRGGFAPGSAAMAAEMMFSSVDDFNDIDNFFGFLFGAGDATLSWNNVVLLSQLESTEKRMSDIFELESKRVRGIRYNEADFEAMRKKLIERLEKNNKLPLVQAWEQSQKALFGDSAYGNSLNADLKSVKTVKMADVKAFYERYYRLDNAVFFVSSDLPADTVRSLATKYLEPVANPSTPLPMLKSSAVKADLSKREVDFDGEVIMTTHAYRTDGILTQPQAAVVTVLSRLMADSKDARLDQYFAESKDLPKLRQAFSANTFGVENGIFKLGAVVNAVDDLAKADAGIAKALQAVKAKPFTNEEVKKVTTDIADSMQNELNRVTHVNQRLANFIVSQNRDWTNGFKAMNAIRNLTAKDVNDFITKLADEQPAIVHIKGRPVSPKPAEAAPEATKSEANKPAAKSESK